MDTIDLSTYVSDKVPNFWPRNITILSFDETPKSLNKALRSALNLRGEEYIFVRLNAHVPSSADSWLTSDYVCIGTELTPSLQSQTLIPEKRKYEALSRLVGVVPSLLYMALLAVPIIPTGIPVHVIDSIVNRV